MKNKKGFAIIETLITTVVLTTALISLYVLFNNIMIKEKRRVYYDDPIFIARSNYIFDAFFKILKEKSTPASNPEYSLNFGDYLIMGSTDDTTEERVYINSFNCNSMIIEDRDACKRFFDNMALRSIYISQFDTSYINTCEHSNEYKCIVYNHLDHQAKLYLRSLPYVPGAEGYYIIFDFYDDGNGGLCKIDGLPTSDCMRQFTSIKYGGSNTVINLK
ncbi:MAG: hypothetical protein IKX00_02055 [Bacilli bacterium]|nr:hypothetical protein [Bacilli bacterium]